MESLEDSNCHSMTDRISLYERYLKSFTAVNSIVDNREQEVGNCEYEERDGSNSCGSNIATADTIHIEHPVADSNPVISSIDSIIREAGNLDLCLKTEYYSNLCASVASTDTSSATQHSILTERSDATDVPVSSEDSKSDCFKQPVFITSTMENSNNAVDSVPLFRNVRPSDSVFKLPIRELSFNGTLKHVQKLKPIVDPISALSCNGVLLESDYQDGGEKDQPNLLSLHMDGNSLDKSNSNASSGLMRLESNDSTGESQYEEVAKRSVIEDRSLKWNDQSHSSLEASFDSGVRSPDMFSDEDASQIESEPEPEPYWNFLKDYEAHDKRRVRKIEEAMSGVLPPPSITNLKIDVTEMLKKYYAFLPAYNNKEPTECNSKTPTKRVSFVRIPELAGSLSVDVSLKKPLQSDTSRSSLESNVNEDLNKSANESINLKMCTETEGKETAWPDIMKCRYHDIYYNTNIYAENFERLALRYGERYVGAETETSVNVYSGGLQSPSSASKRKAMRIKMAQAKSPSRRLSHLARRRQAFCSAATIGERAHSSSSKMVLIDRNFFQHRKLINTNERKSPRTRRTPGKSTPTRKTPAKKTPAKTPKSGSSRKKAMRRLLMDGDNVTRSQPRENLIKRALFISPENRKAPQTTSTSVPSQAMKSKRALFSSPTAETKSLDGTLSDHFLKRKRDQIGDSPEMSRNKIAKSLSFGGDNYSLSQPMSAMRRASEMFPKRSTEFNEIHKKKLVWAVSEALRVFGWRMSSPGFREKASTLARLTRRLLQLPTHKASFSNPHLSTSDTMLKLARQYVYAIIQGRTVEECFEEEQSKLANTNMKLTGYISASAYQQLQDKPKQVACTLTSQIKENRSGDVKQDPPRSGSKNVLQDKTVNIDSNSNSSSGLSMIDKAPLFKSNSMPSFEQAAKMRARRQISFDNLDFPKR